MSIGRKGMVLAAKVRALTAQAPVTDPSQLAAVRHAFDPRRARFAYQSPRPLGPHRPLY